MPLHIIYLNLKDGVIEAEFARKVKESFDYTEGKVEGFGPWKLYRHHFFGANPRMYQIHTEFKDLGTWQNVTVLLTKDAKAVKLWQAWQNLVDMNSHYDEFIREIPL